MEKKLKDRKIKIPEAKDREANSVCVCVCTLHIYITAASGDNQQIKGPSHEDPD